MRRPELLGFSSEILANAALLARIRQETSALHARLDASLGNELFRSRDAYVSFLQGSLSAVLAVEAGIEARLGAHFPAERAGLLRADLAKLGAEVDREANVSSCPLLSVAAAFGAAYVVEGSALGGVVLADRAVAELPGLAAAGATSYLRFRGVDTARRWRWFLAELEAFARTSDALAHSEACAAAVTVFQLYISSFERRRRATT